MRYNILFFIFLNTLLCVCKSQQPTGAVCISEDGKTPDNSAILQISSDKKGVLFPRMSFEAATSIDNKKDGLMVFITDSAKMGYWYWNASEAKWKQIRGEDTDGQDIEAPYGGIIMYSGQVNSSLFNSNGCGYIGTKMQGWQICNGLNGSPNLVGKFIMGSVSATGASGGSDTLKLKMNNIPSHKHDTKPVIGSLESHTHLITDQTHQHSIDVTWKTFRLKRRNHIEQHEDGSNQTDYLNVSTDVGADGNIKLLDQTGTITFSTTDLNTKIEVENTGEGKGIDNRPSFYVLLYLMKINTDGCPTN